jgi:hypothetical protein
VGSKKLEIRSDILEKVTSEEEADVTPFLNMIYLRLVNAPVQYWEGKNVLSFAGRAEDGRTVTTAWEQLAQLATVSPEVVRTALAWLNDNEVISLTTSQEGQEIVISFEGISNYGRLR